MVEVIYKQNENTKTEENKKTLTEDVIVFKKGNKALDNGNYSEAMERFQEAVDINPQYERAWNCLGFILQKFKKYEEAIECYKKAIEINPTSKASNNLGLTLSVMGDHVGAMEYFDMMTKFHPDSTEAWQNKGIVYQKMGNIDASINCFQKVIDLKPKNPKVLVKSHVSRGVSFQKAGDFKSAYEEFNKALKVNPFSVQAWNSKGITLQRLSEYMDAIFCFDKALEIDPKNIQALNSKAFTYQKLEEYDRALEVYFKVALMDGGYNYEAFNGIATCKAKLGDFDKSLEYYNKILKNEKNPYKLAKTEKPIAFVTKLKAREELAQKAEEEQEAADKKAFEEASD